MKLSKTKLGKEYVIEKINCSVEMRRRLLDLGFVKNSCVIPVFTSPFKNPTAYEIRGTIIALRNQDAENIEVKEIG